MARPDAISRSRHERAGRRAEWLAELWLRLKGYRILARRFRSGHGEIDLVAARGMTIAFVEVKACPTRDAARQAISPTAERRIADAAIIWLGRYRPNHRGDIRYDLITVVRGLPRHHPDAFRPGTDSRQAGNLF